MAPESEGLAYNKTIIIKWPSKKDLFDQVLKLKS